MQLVLFLLSLAVTYGAYRWVKHVEAKRNALAVATAHAAGLALELKPPLPPQNGFDLFDRGRARTARYRMARPDGNGTVFIYQYTTGSGKSQRTWVNMCTLVPLPFNAPHTTIGGQGFWSEVGQLVGIRDIEVESTSFNDRFKVKGDDERFAVTLLDQPTIAWMLREPRLSEVHLELSGPLLLCYFTSQEIPRMPEFLDWSIKAATHFPSVLASLYPVAA